MKGILRDLIASLGFVYTTNPSCVSLQWSATPRVAEGVPAGQSRSRIWRPRRRSTESPGARPAPGECLKLKFVMVKIGEWVCFLPETLYKPLWNDSKSPLCRMVSKTQMLNDRNVFFSGAVCCSCELSLCSLLPFLRLFSALLLTFWGDVCHRGASRSPPHLVYGEIY